MKFWRYTYCEGKGGIVIADTKESAIEKLRKKYDSDGVNYAEVWPWENDDHFDDENPDVLNVYDC